MKVEQYSLWSSNHESTVCVILADLTSTRNYHSHAFIGTWCGYKVPSE